MKKFFQRNSDQRIFEAFQKSLTKPQTFDDLRLAKENNVRHALWPDEAFHTQFVKALKDLVAQLESNGISYVLIKTEKRYPYDDSNIDVVCETAKDFSEVQKLAKKAGRTLTKSYHEPDKEMYRLMGTGGQGEYKPGWHLHPAVTWNGVPYLTNASLFRRKRQVTWEGVRFWVPSLEHDILIHAGHTVFENFQITLGEFYDACQRSLQSIDWKFVETEADTNGWKFGLRLFLAALKSYARATGQSCGVPDGIEPWAVRMRFPLRYPLLFQLWSFSERIMYNFQRGNIRAGVRELYAYPAFYLIEKFKHFTHIQYP